MKASIPPNWMERGDHDQKATKQGEHDGKGKPFVARLQQRRLTRMKCCSPGITAGLIIGAPRRGGLETRRKVHELATLVACCLRSPPFPPIGPTDNAQGSVAA